MRLPPLERRVPNREPSPPPDRFQIADLIGLIEHYLPEQETSEVFRAYLYGAEAHEGQHRKSGEAYIFHPLEVARLIAGLRLDAHAIMAALLHDVIEDTHQSKDVLAADFGREVADLVDGVTKITRTVFATREEKQAENFRKMLFAMSKDIRVILIKLADRLHNMRTLGSLEPVRRRAIARETIDIYAPIATRLGMYAWANELASLAFRNLYPMRARVLAEAIRKRHGNRAEVVERVRTAIDQQLAKEGITAQVSGREKHLYSLYRKMQQKSLPFDQVFDAHGFRIVVDRVDTCYRVLGVIHNLYKPIPGKFKDYIAIPKTNGYQSLHTVVFGPMGVSIEVQVRTDAMHRVAEAGVAAHWIYKEGEAEVAGAPVLDWLKNFLEMQRDSGNPDEFLEHLRVDLFPDEVYVFTPKGDIRKLPRGATVVDFAYDVHTDVGNQCVGAYVNHVSVPLRTVLANGDHVDIVTSAFGRPHPAWLDYVKSGKSRACIRAWLKNLGHEESVEIGRRLLESAAADCGCDLATVTEGQQHDLLILLRLKAWDDLLADIGLGNRNAALVARQLMPQGQEPGRVGHAGRAVPAAETRPAIAIRGTEGVIVTYARCCRPIPGDPVFGLLSAGRGITVHTEDCPNLPKFRKHPEQWVDVRWERETVGTFPVALRVEVHNRRGVLANVAAAIADRDSNIDTVNIEERDGLQSAMDFTLEVRDRVHLSRIMRRLRALEAVIRVTRMKG